MKKKFRKVSSTSLVARGKPTRFVSLMFMLSMLIAAMVSSGTFVYIAYASPDSPLYVEEGIYPGAPSYTVWKEDSTYYAKNANGHIDYMSSNGSLVLSNAMVSGGKIVLCGLATVTVAVQIPSNTYFEGQGWETGIEASGNIHAITVLDAENVTIKNMRVVGMGLELSEGLDNLDYDHCIFVNNSRKIRIENCFLTRGEAGVEVFYSEDVWITNNYVENFRHHGINVCFSSKDVVVANNIVNITYIFDAIDIYQCIGHVVVTGNIATGAGQDYETYDSDAAGIHIEGNSTEDMGSLSVVVSNNVVYDNERGICTWQVYHGLLIDSNVAYNNTNYGFFIGSIAPGTVSNNIVYGTNGTGFSFYWARNGSVISDNVAYDNAGNGFYFEGSSNVVINGNTAFDNTDNGFEFEADETGRCYFNTVTGNHIYLNGKHGMNCSSLEASAITGNMLHRNGQTTNNTYSEIFLAASGIPTYSVYNSISGNTIWEENAANRCQYGIRENSGSDDWNCIVGNVVQNAVTANISVQGVNTVEEHNVA